MFSNSQVVNDSKGEKELPQVSKVLRASEYFRKFNAIYHHSRKTTNFMILI